MPRTARLALLIVCLGLLAPPVAGREPDAETRTARSFEAARGNGGAMRLFLERMPKGADLHSHLSGAVYAENIIDWASADGWCADRGFFLSPPPCDPAAGRRPLGEAVKETQAFRDAVDAFSTRNYGRRTVSGHNQFFTTFFRFGAYLPNRYGEMLAEVTRRAGRQGIQYLELMESPGMFEAAALGERVGEAEDYDAAYDRLQAAGLPAIVERARRQYRDALAKKDRLLGCDRDPAAMGCEVEVRWLAQVIRTFPPAMVFAQVALAFDLARQDEMVVGINLVAPEDDQITLKTYSRQMRMIGALKRRYPQVNVTLHAGELTLGIVPPEDLRFHIREAIEIAGARRIGHGIGIAFEDGAEDLLKRMARERILVEVNLTSNDVILGVSGKDHPFLLYRQHGVPMALSTDDEGVSRIDLTHEYQRAAMTYNLGYRDLKQLTRNSLTYSFLPGASLWADAERARPVAACAGGPPGAGEPKPACAAFLAASIKARIQWRLEARIAAFERETAAKP